MYIVHCTIPSSHSIPLSVPLISSLNSAISLLKQSTQSLNKHLSIRLQATNTVFELNPNVDRLWKWCQRQIDADVICFSFISFFPISDIDERECDSMSRVHTKCRSWRSPNKSRTIQWALKRVRYEIKVKRFVTIFRCCCCCCWCHHCYSRWLVILL